MKPQVIFQASSGVVALWFFIAGWLGADTMPDAIYGPAKEAIPPVIWAVWIMAAVAVYLLGVWWDALSAQVLGTAFHLVAISGLMVFSLTAEAFSPVAPWTVIFTAWLAVCLTKNIEAWHERR